MSHPTSSTLTRRSALKLASAAIAYAVFPPSLHADAHPDWTAPMPPYRIAGNLYYVGSRELASFLITSPQGHILINSNLVTSPPQIRASIEKLGFRFSDVKILLISHAHFDHCSGSAAIVKQTGAHYMVMDADVADVESGGHTNFEYAHDRSKHYPPAKVDRILHDGDTVSMGDTGHPGNTVLTAHKTAGHTKGCTTWTMTVQQNGKDLHAVIVGSPNVLSSYNLIHDPRYPRMADDFAAGFRTLKALPCDIFLGSHGGYYDMLAKYARLQAGDASAFIDPEGYRSFIAEREQTFLSELDRQRRASLSRPRTHYPL